MQLLPTKTDGLTRSQTMPVPLKMVESPACLRIAVLDDEALIRDLLADMLDEQGHSTTCFETALDVLKALTTQWFDVIVSDIKMPAMSGIEFYDRVLQSHPEQAARIIYLSGDLLAPATYEFFDRTGCLYLTKPFRCAALLAKIEELQQRLCRATAAPDAWELPRAA